MSNGRREGIGMSVKGTPLKHTESLADMLVRLMVLENILRHCATAQIYFYPHEPEVVAIAEAVRRWTERDALRAAITTHRAQKADDRCIEDDDRLYEALGDGIKCDRRVGSKIEMLANCQRFIEHRCESGGWKSYAELEAELDQCKRECDVVVKALVTCAVPLEAIHASVKWELSYDLQEEIAKCVNKTRAVLAQVQKGT